MNKQFQPTSSLVLLFLQWFFISKPVLLVKLYLKTAVQLEEVLSVIYMFRTLFSPWKRLLAKKDGTSTIMTRILDNAISRCIGAIMRVIMMLISLILQLVLLIIFALGLFAWFALPLFLLVLPWYIFT